MPTIEIKAIDTLFFRDGKPFEMEDDSWAEGIFPPPLSVLKGAIRSAYFTEFPDQIKLANSNDDPTQDIQITRMYLKKGNKLYLPAPLDYVYEKSKKIEDTELFHLSIIDRNKVNLATNYKLPFLTFSEENVENSSYYFIDKQDFESFYRNNDVEETLFPLHLSEILKTESKVGVGISKHTRSSKKGRLFRVGMNRLSQEFDEEELTFEEESSFVIEYDLEFIPKLIKLGAENKVATVSEAKITPSQIIEKKHLASSFFKIMLITPAVFENGWKPNMQNYLPSIEVELKCAFIGKPLSIGGWDIERKEPKTMYKAVPAGSVFYYEITNGRILEDVQVALSKTQFLSDYSIDMGIFEIAALNFEQLKLTI